MHFELVRAALRDELSLSKLARPEIQTAARVAAATSASASACVCVSVVQQPHPVKLARAVVAAAAAHIKKKEFSDRVFISSVC